MSTIKEMLEESRWIANEPRGLITFVPHGKLHEYYSLRYPYKIHVPRSVGVNLASTGTSQRHAQWCRDQWGYAAYRESMTGGFNCGMRSSWHHVWESFYFKKEEHAVLFRVMMV